MANSNVTFKDASNVTQTHDARTNVAGDEVRPTVTLGNDGDNVAVVDAAGSLQVALLPPTTGTITSTALALTAFTLLASNTNRRGAAFYNDSANVVYLALASGASTTAYTVQIPAGGYYELPDTGRVYSGIVTGIALTASGSVRSTEMT